MSTNKNLNKAKAEKNDEFYTQLHDIETEINAYLEYDPDVFRGKTILLPCDDPEWSNFTRFFVANFARLGLKRLISTCYTQGAKEPDLFTPVPKETRGKLLIVDEGKVESAKWRYLDGDGDFRGDEVTKLRDEADCIITNPPFSLFREFLSWILEANKKFIVLGHVSAIVYKDTFPLIRDNTIWLGATGIKNKKFRTLEKPEKDDSGGHVVKMVKTCWYTNVEHGRRREPLTLMTIDENIKQSGHIYEEYDNYNAVEVPYVKAIPSDYEGIMGVPITYMGVHCPEQFEVIDIPGGANAECLRKPNHKRYNSPYLHGKCLFRRIFIRKK